MIYAYILVMALTTYLIRMLPLTLLQKRIQNTFLRSFLFYVPYACLTAMTFPSILSATASVVSAAVGLGGALVLAWRGKGMRGVALWSCAAVFITERLLPFLPLGL